MRDEMRRSLLLQERSEQDQLSRAIESNICFYPVFILLTLHYHLFLTVTLSSVTIICLLLFSRTLRITISHEVTQYIKID